MALTAGTKLGPYEIVAPLGAGGMGEVYRARDTKLGRDVALKLLPPLFTANADRVARFEREARLLASLNHPHIGAIYGFEDAGNVPALVLELVEGDTLDNHVRRGPLPLSEALAVAQQIADALDAAHRAGIIHRDLKPSNIKITSDGVVKVLDFGLGKALAADGSGPDLSKSPTITAEGTIAGAILGTAAYMSPEQARGQPVDKRTDIWAFGCVLFEMLTGSSAFVRETTTDTIAAVVGTEPEWKSLPAETPASIRRLVMRSLQKDARRRLHDIGDARIELEETMAAPAEAALVPSPRRWSRLAISTLLLGIATAFVLLWAARDRFGRPAAAAPDTRASSGSSMQSVSSYVLSRPFRKGSAKTANREHPPERGVAGQARTLSTSATAAEVREFRRDVMILSREEVTSLILTT
jgi:serine/threonine protein kinase